MTKETGTLAELNVKPGDAVKAGDVVAVMEAMKMETEVRAVSSGKVVSMGISAGDSVTVGQILVTLG